VPKLYAKVSVYTAFAVMLALLLMNAAVTRRQLQIQIQKRGLAVHSRMVLLAVDRVSSLLVDAETGQRGYLYTGDARYLEPYHRSISQVEPAIQKLAELTRDNSAQQAHVAALRELGQKKLNELRQTIDLAASGRNDEARAMVLTNSGKRTMDQLRAELSAMRDIEDELSANRDEEYTKSTHRTAYSIYGATLVAIIGLAFLAHYVLLQMRLREEHTAAIREREQWFRVTLASIGDGVLATDHAGKVTYVNEVAEELIGFKAYELSEKPILEAFPIFNELTQKPAENPVQKVLAQGKVVGLANHTVLKHRDGRLIPIEDSAAPIRNDANQIIGVVLVFRDATHDRHSQELLRRAEKLAAAGRLASTMAHEINNPLEAVGNLIFIARNSPSVPPDVQQHLLIAEQQLGRVSHITRQTLGFHREHAVIEQVQLSSLVDSVLALYENKLQSKGIQVQRNFHEVPPITGFSGELRQLVANLISNAADAVPKQGNIWISIVSEKSNGSSGAKLQVEDDGPGVPPENRNRIFEPFFTTKNDVGTGLGLWVVKEVVERHGGSVSVSGRNGYGGAMFSVFLPAKAAEVAKLSTSA